MTIPFAFDGNRKFVSFASVAFVRHWLVVYICTVVYGIGISSESPYSQKKRDDAAVTPSQVVSSKIPVICLFIFTQPEFPCSAWKIDKSLHVSLTAARVAPRTARRCENSQRIARVHDRRVVLCYLQPAVATFPRCRAPSLVRMHGAQVDQLIATHLQVDDEGAFVLTVSSALE